MNDCYYFEFVNLTGDYSFAKLIGICLSFLDCYSSQKKRFVVGFISAFNSAHGGVDCTHDLHVVHLNFVTMTPIFSLSLRSSLLIFGWS